MIKAKFHFFQIAHEVPGADAMIFQHTFFQVAPEAFDAVDRGGTTDLFLLAVVDAMVRFKGLLQLIIALPRIAVNRGLQRHFTFEDLLQCLFCHIVHWLHIHDPIRALIDAKDGLLQLLGPSATLDLPGFPQMRPHRPSPVPKFRPTIGLIHFHFAIQQVNRPILVGDNRVPQPMEKPMHLLIIHTQPVGNRVIRQFQFEPMQQFVHRRPGYRRPRHPGIGPQPKLLVASRTLPAVVAQRPQFPGVATLRTAGPIPKISCTPNPVNLRATQIGRKNVFHMQLYTS